MSASNDLCLAEFLSRLPKNETTTNVAFDRTPGAGRPTTKTTTTLPTLEEMQKIASLIFNEADLPTMVFFEFEDTQPTTRRQYEKRTNVTKRHKRNQPKRGNQVQDIFTNMGRWVNPTNRPQKPKKQQQQQQKSKASSAIQVNLVDLMVVKPSKKSRQSSKNSSSKN